MKLANILLISHIFLLISCTQNWNSPYSNQENEQKILYSNFSNSPKHLDPAKSYSSDEILFLDNIYEPPLQYNYLKRPYELEPLTAVRVPKERIIKQNGKRFYIYDINIQPNILYAPHVALAPSRQVTANDYIYQIKRLADPTIHSPIAPIMATYIDGFTEFTQHLKNNPDKDSNLLDMRGLRQVSKYHYQIILKQAYPQFKYWLAMSFFAPMPPELIAWHANEKRPDGHLGIDWYPHGSGPFMLTENNPNYRFTLERNLNYREAYYPNGKKDKRLPLLDKIVFNLEKERIPEWNKFLQGYYDISGISSDNFDQTIELTEVGTFALSKEFQKKNLQLKTIVAPSVYYLGFNMLDPIVGGYTEAKQKLRQAISIALNSEELISIFTNGRGIPAQGPIPPGIFGQLVGKQGINTYIYTWQNNKAQRRSIDEAKELLRQAGYPNGIDPKTNYSLKLHYDTVGGASGSRSSLEWYRRQFKKLNIDLNLRLTDYNRFHTKVNNGQAQILSWGWNADYPDPENFLFLLYGGNAKVESGGENAVNYKNAEYDQLFNQMKILPNSQQRQNVINKMLEILRKDAPWHWGIHPKSVGLYHEWVGNVYPIPITKNIFKYRDINPQLRLEKRNQWNKPAILPLVLISLIVILIACLFFWRIQQQQNIRLKKQYIK